MCAVESKPEWVPEWIWDEYLEAFSDVDECEQREKLIVTQILNNPRCAVIWRAITSRKGVLERSYEKPHELRKWGFVWEPFMEAATMLGNIAYFAQGMSESMAVSASARRADGNRISRLASLLHKAIQDAPGFATSDTFELAMERTAKEIHSEELSLLTDEYITNNKKLISAEWIGVHAGVSSVLETLKGLEIAALEWAKTSPPVTHLGSNVANRLYFIRETTDYFRWHYKTPLRECVAALTSCIFNCDIDAATVAKLAP